MVNLGDTHIKLMRGLERFWKEPIIGAGMLICGLLLIHFHLNNKLFL